MKRQTILRVYIAILACAAIILPLLTIESYTAFQLRIIDFLFWAALVVWAELSPITLPKGEASLSVGGVIDCSIIVLFPTPLAAIFGMIAGVTNSLKRRVTFERFVFNVAMFVITMSVSSMILEFTHAKLYDIVPSASVTPSAIMDQIIPVLLPFIGAIITYFIINTGLTSIAIGISEKESPIYIWNVNYKWTMPSVAAMGPIGLVIAIVYILLSAIDHKFAIIGVMVFFFPTLIIRYSQRLFVDINNAYFNSIKALVSALDASHHYTQGHSMRVSHNAGIVAKQLKLSDSEIETIERGAMLHDIGKIGLDKKILDKTSALSDQEWIQVRQHPVLGANIIGELTFLKDARNVVLHHHERMDGKGYPIGLKGDEISVGARIVNALDAFDALTSDRSYRKRLTHDQAITMLREKSGAQFDSEIVDSITNLVKKNQLVFQDDSEDSSWDNEPLFSILEVQEALSLANLLGHPID
ncbi:HD-GYP domain-containing protein [Gemmatimonadota bacterium]